MAAVEVSRDADIARVLENPPAECRVHSGPAVLGQGRRAITHRKLWRFEVLMILEARSQAGFQNPAHQ